MLPDLHWHREDETTCTSLLQETFDAAVQENIDEFEMEVRAV